jgi:hypothetical protein
MRRLTRDARQATDQDFPGGRARSPGRAAAIDAAVANARLTDHLDRVIGVAWAVVAVGAVAATGLALSGVGPVELAPSGSAGARVLHYLINAGTYLISLTILGMLLLGVQAYRNERVRRIVGVVWDLATFWPRAAHPLGVPCYAERAVPELAHRGAWLATDGGGVVYSGHSQGAVLVAAAVLQVPEAARPGTALLTYGSPLRRLYARAFPAYLNDAVFAGISDAVADVDGPRWTNLWRRTDPIGGPQGGTPGVTDTPDAAGGAAAPAGGDPVTGPAAPGGPDVRFVDPVAFDPPPGDLTPPSVEGHFNYQFSPGFAARVAALLARLRP